MKLPKLYAPVTISFYSLRMGIGSNRGAVFDVDTLVTHKCRRVRIEGGWKWQIVNYHEEAEFNYEIEQDKLMLDEYWDLLEFEHVNN